MMARVSVLMTVYNGMPHLPAAVESVRTQSLRDFRFVIVNDGSTDGTSDYLASIRDERLQVIHQHNAGTAAAANAGLASCHADFTARMDADDISLPERLERQVEFLDQHADVIMVGTQVRPLGDSGPGHSLHLPTEHDEIDTALINNKHGMAHSSIMLRTSALKSLGGYWSHQLVDDWDMMLRMAELGCVANLPEVLLHYRIHAESQNATTLRHLRFSYDFACELARRRRSGEPPITPDEFRGALARRPWWQRAADTMDLYARTQYRRAQGELYNGHPWSGRARMLWAACWAPRLTWDRIARMAAASVPDLRIARRVAPRTDLTPNSPQLTENDSAMSAHST